MASFWTLDRKSFVCSAALLLGLGACGGPRAPMGQWGANLSSLSTIDFRSFCAEWALTCPEGDPAPFPTDKIRWDLDQTRAAATVAQAVLSTRTPFTMTLEDWLDPRLEGGARALGLDRPLAQAQDFWTRVGLSHLVAKDGVLEIHLEDTAQFQSKLGFRVQLAPLVALRFGTEGVLSISGVSLASPGGEDFEPLTEAWPREGATADLKIGNRIVTASPQRLMFEVIIDGLQLADFDSLRFDYPQVVASLGGVLEWVRVKERTLDYGPDFFAMISAQLPKILPISAGYRGVIDALAATARFEGRAEGGKPAATVTQFSGKQLVCTTVAGGVTYDARFEPQFGISAFQVMGPSRIALRLFGVSGGISGLPGRLIQFSRIDVTPEGVVVENVPLLGRIAIDLERLKNLRVNCRS